MTALPAVLLEPDRVTLDVATVHRRIALGRPVIAGGPERSARMVQMVTGAHTFQPFSASGLGRVLGVVPAAGRLHPVALARLTAGTSPPVGRVIPLAGTGMTRGDVDPANLTPGAQIPGASGPVNGDVGPGLSSTDPGLSPGFPALGNPLPSLSPVGPWGGLSPTNPTAQPGGGPAVGTITGSDVVRQAQILLGVWTRLHPTSTDTADFGSSPQDFSGVSSARWIHALSQFQSWWDAQGQPPAINTAGTLDGPTYTALQLAAGQSLSPVPAPVPAPAPPADTSAASPTAIVVAVGVAVVAGLLMKAF